MSGITMDDIENTLQRVASASEVTATEVRELKIGVNALASAFDTHRRDDREDFNKVFTIIEANRVERNTAFDKAIDRITDRLDVQDAKLATATAAKDRSAGANRVIYSIIAFLGAGVITLLGVLLNHLWGH